MGERFIDRFFNRKERQGPDPITSEIKSYLQNGTLNKPNQILHGETRDYQLEAIRGELSLIVKGKRSTSEKPPQPLKYVPLQGVNS